MDAAIRKAKDSIGNMFDKNLHDLVRGIRNHKENEAKYIAECIDEIKLELKQDNMAVKANAINKLCYVLILIYFLFLFIIIIFIFKSLKCLDMISVGLHLT